MNYHTGSATQNKRQNKTADMTDERYLRVWAEIDIDAIRYNVKKIMEGHDSNVMACAVIKADGYGHGAVQLAKSLDDLTDFYAVAAMEEALELRHNGISKPVLILGAVNPVWAETAIENDIRLTVFDYESAELISYAAAGTGKTANVHIKVDTGMGRIGFIPGEEALAEISKISMLEGINIEGIFTHFAKADDEGPEDALRQFDLFRSFISSLEERNIHIPVRHCSNSAAATNIMETEMDMVRLGISIYGLYPSEHVKKITLKPALSLRSHVVMVKTVPAGTKVGYGSTWTADKESVIATISAGYADGYMRRLSNKGYVSIRGIICPVAGRVCMDQIMVDATNVPGIAQGDVVTLIGTDGDQTITVEEISELAGSFNYEFVCNLSRRVPRIYYSGEKVTDFKDSFNTIDY